MVLFVNEDLPLARVPRCVATLDKPGIIEREAVLFFFEMEAIMSSKNRLTTTTIKHKSTDCVVFLCLWGGC